MQYENENMDELFRRAAENYPLDTSSKDWSKVQQALESSENEGQVVRKNNKGRFLWLLALLPLGLVCNKYLMNSGDGTEKIASQQTHNPSSATKVKDEVKAKDEKSDASLSTHVAPTTGKIYDPSTRNDADATDQTSDESTASIGVAKQKGVRGTKPAAFAFAKKPGAGKTAQASAGNQNIGHKNDQYVNNTNSGTDADPYDLRAFVAVSERNSFIAGRPSKNSFLSQPSSVFAANELTPREGSLPKAKSSDKKFYVGLMGGMDMTTIKFQKLENVGYDAGILLGYDLNKKLSIETGFFMDKKIYYTKGEHFSTSKIYVPPGTWINEVSGYCKMFEVPLNLKYTISSSPKKSWFIAAGGSSYLMREENYTYLYQNSVSQWPKDKQYQSSDNYFFSVIQLSGGFTHKIGKVGDLRVEPYLKLPLKGMGVGELPFFSSGLHVGITRKLF